jgi:hypothetical protein
VVTFILINGNNAMQCLSSFFDGVKPSAPRIFRSEFMYETVQRTNYKIIITMAEEPSKWVKLISQERHVVRISNMILLNPRHKLTVLFLFLLVFQFYVDRECAMISGTIKV